MSRLKEQRAWDVFSDNAQGRLQLHRVENSIGQSMPDLIGINRRGGAFWAELKALEDWPKRAATKPLARAFEPGQIPFAKQWIGWRGNSYVILRVGAKEWYLLWPKPWAAGAIFETAFTKELVDLTTAELKQVAVAEGLESIIDYLEGVR